MFTAFPFTGITTNKSTSESSVGAPYAYEPKSTTFSGLNCLTICSQRDCMAVMSTILHTFTVINAERQ